MNIVDIIPPVNFTVGILLGVAIALPAGYFICYYFWMKERRDRSRAFERKHAGTLLTLLRPFRIEIDDFVNGELKPHVISGVTGDSIYFPKEWAESDTENYRGF